VTIIVDASVAVKWVTEEEGSATARTLVVDEILAAPEFLILECANALRIKSRRGVLDAQEAKAALSALQSTPIQLFGTSDYVADAHALAFELDQTVYDSLYLAVALAHGAVLVTADSRFFDGVIRHAVHAHAVRLLGSS